MNGTIEGAAQRARAVFEEGGFHCAESTLLAIAEHQGIESDLIPKVATGFGSGMARTCGLCGAVTGAMMGLGLVNGRNIPGADREANYAAVQRFLQAFKDRFGSINCYDLTGGCDLATPEGQQQFKEKNVAALCNEYVEAAVGLALAAADSA